MAGLNAWTAGICAGGLYREQHMCLCCGYLRALAGIGWAASYLAGSGAAWCVQLVACIGGHRVHTVAWPACG